MDFISKTGVVVAIGYIALLVHEGVTGLGFIRGVAIKFVVTYGMQPFAAHNAAIATILIAPIIALLGLLAFKKIE